jgi:VanZ family protein
MNKSVRLHLPTILYVLLIFIVSSLRGFDAPDLGFDFGDKVCHVLEYGVFGFLLMRSGQGLQDRIPYPLFLIVLLTGALYAASDEIHQYFVPGRECDALDFAADAIGIALGQTVYWMILMRFRKQAIGDGQ